MVRTYFQIQFESKTNFISLLLAFYFKFISHSDNFFVFFDFVFVGENLFNPLKYVFTIVLVLKFRVQKIFHIKCLFIYIAELRSEFCSFRFCFLSTLFAILELS